MTAYLRGSNANLGGAFVDQRGVRRAVDQARQAAADFTGSRPEEIAFGANMTTLNFLLAHAVARTLKQGDEIIVTQLDHDGERVAVAAHRGRPRAHGAHGRRSRAGRRHARPRRARGAADRPHEDRRLHARVERRRHEARRAAHRRRRARASARWPGPTPSTTRRTAASTGAALGLDVALCSPYKFFGPHLGMAAIRHDLAERWPADRVRPADETPAGPPVRDGHAVARGAGRLRGRRRLPGRASARAPRSGARLDSAFARIGAHEEDALGARAARGSRRRPACASTASPTRPASRSARRPSRSPSPVPTPRDIAGRAGRARACSCGTATTTPLGAMLALGLEEHGGAVRAGFLHYTTPEEVDRLCDLVEARRTRKQAQRLRYNRRAACGCGGIGRRARFRSVWPKGRGGSSPLIRTVEARSSSGLRSFWSAFSPLRYLTFSVREPFRNAGR